MNSEQNARQIRKLLQERRIDGDAAKNLLFYAKAVLIAADPLEAAWKVEQLPAAIISPAALATDPEGGGQEADLVEYRYRIQLLMGNANDQFGQAALIGAGKQAALDSSRGMGLDWVLSQARRAVRYLAPTAQGVTIGGAADDGAGVLSDGQRRTLAYREFFVKVLGTGDAYFHPPENFRGTALTAGNSLAWSLPPDRFDLLGIRLCRVAGSTPTTNPETGIVTTWTIPYSGLPTSVTNAPGPGVFSYSLFALYDARNDAPIAPYNKYSDPATVTI